MTGRFATVLRRLAIDRPDARAWALYDWANSAMVTTIITAVFPVYYLAVAAAPLGDGAAQERFADATTFSLASIALLAPLLGAVADLRGSKKGFLAGFVFLGVVSVAGMFFIQEGDWLAALILFGLANAGAAGSVVFYDALLPHVARPEEMDRLSTTGYAMGYVGGGLLLALNLAWIKFPAAFGLPSGEGLSPAEETLPTRLALLSVALWWGLFTIPLLRRVREPERMAAPPGAERRMLRFAVARLVETVRELRLYRQALLMLVAFLIYNDGIVTVIRMAALYATGRDLEPGVIIATILAVQFVGIPFAILFGRLSGRFGAKRLVLVGLCVYVGICLFAFRMSTNTHFVLMGLAVAMVQGGCQALSRSLFASMIPKHKSAEFFAFFAVGEKFAGILGPLVYGLVLRLVSDQGAILSVVIFFLLGGFLLTRVDVEAGRRTAREAERAALSG